MQATPPELIVMATQDDLDIRAFAQKLVERAIADACIIMQCNRGEPHQPAVSEPDTPQSDSLRQSARNIAEFTCSQQTSDISTTSYITDHDNELDDSGENSSNTILPSDFEDSVTPSFVHADDLTSDELQQYYLNASLATFCTLELPSLRHSDCETDRNEFEIEAIQSQRCLLEDEGTGSISDNTEFSSDNCNEELNFHPKTDDWLHMPMESNGDIESFAACVVAFALKSGLSEYRRDYQPQSGLVESELNPPDYIGPEDCVVADDNSDVTPVASSSTKNNLYARTVCDNSPQDRDSTRKHSGASQDRRQEVGKKKKVKPKKDVSRGKGKPRKAKCFAETFAEIYREDMEFDDTYSCPVCWDVFLSPHTCRPCCHRFCEPCLRRLAKYCRDAGRPALCPICRQPILFCVKDFQFGKQAEEAYPNDYHRRRRTEGRGRYMTHPLPSADLSTQPPEQIAQVLALRRQQRQRQQLRLGFMPIRLNIWRFISFALVFILLKGMVGVAFMALYNMSLGYVIGDMIASTANVFNNLRTTNIVFSWICSAFAFSITALLFFIGKRVYQNFKNR